MNVRFSNPHERVDRDQFGTTLEDFAKKDPALAKRLANPSEEKQMKAELTKAYEQVRQATCSSPKERAIFEAKLKDRNLGLKRRQIFQGLLDACKEKDPGIFVKRVVELDARTCSVWVDSFYLTFRRLEVGHWIARTEKPSLLSNTLKVYELKRRDGNYNLWVLTETIIPVAESGKSTPKGKPEQTTWSWDGNEEYEISCDFISHRGVLAPSQR